MFALLSKFNYPKELILILLQSRLGLYGSTLIMPIVFVLIYFSFIPMYILIPWLLLQITLFIVRIVSSRYIIKKFDALNNNEANKALKHYLFIIFINSALWGLISGAVIVYTPPIYVYIFFTIILAMQSSASSSLGTIFHAVFIFLTTMTLLIIVSTFLFSDDQIYFTLALLVLVYYFFALPASYKTYHFSQQYLEQNGILQESIKNFEDLLDTAIETIAIFDEKYNIVQINQAGVGMFNFDNKNDAIGRNILSFIPEHEKEKTMQGIMQEESTPYEVELLTKNQKIFPTLSSGRNIIRNNKKFRITTIVDLSELKQKDKQMLQQSRLAQMGEMISMIAHQWRQPLGAISSSTINLKIKLELDNFDCSDEVSQKNMKNYFLKNLSNIEDYVSSLSTIIDDFRNFYKPTQGSNYVCFENIIQKVLSIIGDSLCSHHIEIISHYHSSNKIQIYENEMMQVILNILKNAQDNFKEKSISKPTITLTTQENSLLICDNGGGIDEAIIDKVFDPYFSTKLEKNGTGLGLYISKIIVQEHHKGTLHVTNTNDGVCFNISLKGELNS